MYRTTSVVNQTLGRLWPRRGVRAPIALLVLLLLLTACGAPQDDAGGQEQPLPVVTVQAVTPQSVQVEGEYAGRVRGFREVEVRARVDGILEERLYTEGQLVEAGDPLFRIDPEPYEIAVRRAEAERGDAAASLAQAKREWDRISGLYQQDAVSRRERDQAETNLQLAEARLAMSEAALADARRNLRYTEVTAPVSGATDLETLPEGSLIERGALLTVVTRHDPAHVRFALPENDAAIQRVARRAMGRVQDEVQTYAAQVILPGGEAYEREGQVDFTASTIDPRTGTVSVRAVFENPDGDLVPGQFVRVRLVLQELEDVFLIDQNAVGEGRDGPRVFVVDDEDVAHIRTVRLGPVVDGRQVVLEGLDEGDRLVVNGQVALSDGASVEVTETNGES
ncbi:efflux RND transporter periplasmic adaptor subunit [Thioalkalivibrio sp. HL-Eb18]|uniref:efflux RND transporter periplasmic adaptor subunit n=1 Tax=Thioalkalivibrio sp. HL-Eb18 TaxID=1266913 RepID=UPI0004772198|nr:efflux RND transporter periplasmic adaptor subunit [Thioalkalivibrio sp. HL-Eb18]